MGVVKNSGLWGGRGGGGAGSNQDRELEIILYNSTKLFAHWTSREFQKPTVIFEVFGKILGKMSFK